MKRMKKVDIIARAEQLEDLKEALNKIGIQGMTVSQVFGCGLQKGHTEVYRGQQYDVNSLQTGEVGDGKIFVYDVEDAMRIRTGTRGTKAVTDDEA